jgi:hypothetical protein
MPAPAPVTTVESLEDEEEREIMTQILRDIESVGCDDALMVVPADVQCRICLIVRTGL